VAVSKKTCSAVQFAVRFKDVQHWFLYLKCCSDNEESCSCIPVPKIFASRIYEQLSKILTLAPFFCPLLYVCNLQSANVSSAASFTNFALWIGFEQIKSCPANTCNEEPGKSWFWTTPNSGDSYPAIIANWSPSYPSDSTNTRQQALLTYSGLMDVSNTTVALGLCEYGTITYSNIFQQKQQCTHRFFGASSQSIGKKF
jgi:hypothetical protein